MWLPILAVALCALAHVASECPPGAVEGVNPYDCFLLVSDDPQDQEDAWDGCWKRGGALASIQSSRESYIVNALVDVDKTGPYWIGATWDAREGTNGAFSWMDNSPWNYTNWDKGQPYIYPFVEGICVTVDPKTRKWSTSYCLPQARNYVCKVPSTQLPIVPSSPKPAKSQCQEGWKYVSVTKKCYKVSSTLKSWYAALYDCRSQGGDLAVAHNEAANLAITAVGRPHERYAIGLYNPKRCRRSNPSCKWQWVDGSSANYTHWMSDQPDDNSNCGYIDSTDDLAHCPGPDKWPNNWSCWADWPCERWEKYICEMAPFTEV